MGDSPAVTTPPIDASTDAADTSTASDANVADAADASDAFVEAEAGPPTPTGNLKVAFQSRGDGDSDFNPFFTGDVAPPVAFDAAGNAYFAGSFAGTTSFGNPNGVTCNLTAKGGAADTDGYVAKIDPKGDCVAAARIGGAATYDGVRALAVSPSGAVIVFGQLFKANGAGSIGWSVNGGTDTNTTNGAFLVGLDAKDLSFKFMQDMLPQSNATEPRAVAIGPGGTIAVSGSVPWQASYQFTNGGGAVTSNGPGFGYQGFVAEYQINGGLSFARVWTAKTTTPTCISTGGGVGYAPNGDLLVSGRALGAQACDFLANSGTVASNPPADWSTAPAPGPTSTTSYLILRYDPKNAGAFKGVYTKVFNGSGYARGMAVDSKGSPYALFTYSSGSGFKFGAGTIAAGSGAVLLHLDTNLAEVGGRLLVGSASASDVVVDPFSNVVVAGVNQTDLDFGNGKTSKFLGGTYDSWIAKFDGSLASCLWLNAYATADREEGAGLAVASDGTIAFHGAFYGANLPLDKTTTLANKDSSTKTTDGWGGYLAP